ncbi:MAG: hypothetical protein V3V08_05885 [Nannocystaceae bacterium]
MGQMAPWTRETSERFDRERCRRPPVMAAQEVRATLHELVDKLDTSQLWSVTTAAFTEALGAGSAAQVTAYLDALISRTPFVEITERLAAAGSRQVLFIARRPYFSIVREALHLRERGWTCHLVYLEPHAQGLEACIASAFAGSWRIQNSLLLLEALLRRVHTGVVHVQTWQFDYHTTVAVQRACTHVPVVAEFVDVASLIGDLELLALRFPIDDVKLDLAMEGEICREADAVLTRFAPPAWRVLSESHGRLTRFMVFWPYPSPKFCCHEPQAYAPPTGRPVRAVYAGGVSGPPVPNVPVHAFGGQTLPEVFRCLLEQGIEVDVLHDPYRPLGVDTGLHTAYRDLLSAFPTFRMVDGAPPDLLPARIAGYDLGLMAFKVPPQGYWTRPELIQYGIGTKIFPYLEAGLPVLVTSEFEAASRLVQEHGLGLSIPSEELGSFAQHLRPHAFLDWRTNVARYVEAHGMHREIVRLEALYDELLATYSAACPSSD